MCLFSSWKLHATWGLLNTLHHLLKYAILALIAGSLIPDMPIARPSMHPNHSEHAPFGSLHAPFDPLHASSDSLHKPIPVLASESNYNWTRNIASFIFRLWFQKDFNWLSIMTLSIFNPLWCNKLQIIPDAADICGRALVLRLETIHTAVHCASFVLHLASDALFQSKGGYWCSCRLVCNDTVLLLVTY